MAQYESSQEIYNYPIKELGSSDVFRWDKVHNQIFQTFVDEYSLQLGDERASFLLDTLITQLGFDKYRNQHTNKGEDVMGIISKKVNDKLSMVMRKKRPIRTGNRCSSRLKNQNESDGSRGNVNVQVNKQVNNIYTPKL